MEIRFIMLGKTGAGKSRTGNTILGRSETSFRYRSSSSSCTTSCEIQTSYEFGKKVVVIDTPGLFDTCKDNNQIQTEVWESIWYSTPGPHAFLLCVEMGRITKEDLNVIEHYKNVFGERILKNVIIVFTKFDNWERDASENIPNANVELFVERLSPDYKEVLRQCGNRYVAFNNRNQKVDEYKEQVNKLLKITDDIRKKQGYYSNDKIKKAHQIFSDLVSERNINLVEEKSNEEKNKTGGFAKEKIKKALFKSFLQVLGNALFEGIKFAIEHFVK